MVRLAQMINVGRLFGKPKMPGALHFSSNQPRIMASAVNLRVPATRSVLGLTTASDALKAGLMEQGVFHQTCDGRDSETPKDPIWGSVHKVLSGREDIFLNKSWKAVAANEPADHFNEFLSACVFGPARVALEESNYARRGLLLKLKFNDPFTARRVLKSRAFNSAFKIKDVRMNPKTAPKGRISRLELVMLRLSQGVYEKKAEDKTRLGWLEARARDFFAQISTASGYESMSNDEIFLEEENRAAAARLKERFAKRLPFTKFWSNEMQWMHEKIIENTRKTGEYPLGIEEVEIIAELLHPPEMPI